jgi:hypothetical protein
VSHCSLAIYIKKYLKAKEELWKFKYFTMQKYNLKKKSSKRNQNPSRYSNSINKSSFNTSQNIIFQKSFYKNRPTTYGPKSLKLTILYNEFKHNILALVGKANKPILGEFLAY